MCVLHKNAPRKSPAAVAACQPTVTPAQGCLQPGHRPQRSFPSGSHSPPRRALVPAHLPSSPSSGPGSPGRRKVTSFKEKKGGSLCVCVCTLGVCMDVLGFTCCQVYNVANKLCFKNRPLWCVLPLCSQRVKKKTSKCLFMVLIGDV